jgi:hypothetical protein
MGMTFLDSEPITHTLSEGVYRLEISTPDNIGKYVADFGINDGGGGYWNGLKNARLTQSHFGYSIFKMLTSSLVYYPLGFVFLMLLIYKVRKYRNLISNVS